MQDKIVLIIKSSLIFLAIGFVQNSFAKDVVSVDISPPPSSSSLLTTESASLVQNPALAMIPAAPSLKAKSYVLMDASSGYIIAEKNAGERIDPASLTKMMTLYLAANALRSGQVKLEDKVVISEKAWRTSGSRMFIRVGSSVTFHDLIRGSAVASGNDATVAIAEHLGGTEDAFVDLMNQAASDLKMENTNYADSVGFTHENNYSTAFDLAALARSWLTHFPEYYPWFKEKWIIYNKIKQPNRNRLLWRDSSVDGVKTGHTEKAGYCLVSSAKRNEMRLIAVIIGAKTDNDRAEQSKALLNYGFRFFETRKLFTNNTKMNSPKVLFGKKSISNLGLKEDLYVTVPIGQYKNLKAKASIKKHLKAPISKGDVCGELNILLNGKVMVTKPLVALEDNPKCNFIFRIVDYIKMLF